MSIKEFEDLILEQLKQIIDNIVQDNLELPILAKTPCRS